MDVLQKLGLVSFRAQPRNLSASAIKDFSTALILAAQRAPAVEMTLARAYERGLMNEMIDLKSEVKQRFDIDGFVNFGRVVDDAELQALRVRIDEIGDGIVAVPAGCIRFQEGWSAESSGGLSRREATWQLLDLHPHDDVVRAICETPLIRETIEDFLEGPARLWSDQVIMKPAHHGSVVPWHQDTSYWGQEKRMTCWLAIDDATPANGCMRMIPGSHRRGQLEYTPRVFDGVDVHLLETNAVDPDTQIYVPVPAGCASFHHPLTLHASDVNSTAHSRRALAITYQAV